MFGPIIHNVSQMKPSIFSGAHTIPSASMELSIPPTYITRSALCAADIAAEKSVVFWESISAPCTYVTLNPAFCAAINGERKYGALP